MCLQYSLPALPNGRLKRMKRMINNKEKIVSVFLDTRIFYIRRKCIDTSDILKIHMNVPTNLPLSLLLSLLLFPTSSPLSVPSQCKEKIQLLAKETSRGVIHRDARHDDSPIIFTIVTHPNGGADVSYLFTHAPTHPNAVTSRAKKYKKIFEVVCNFTHLPFHALTFLVNPSDFCCHPFPYERSFQPSPTDAYAPYPILSHCVSKLHPEECAQVGLIPSYTSLSIFDFLSHSRGDKMEESKPLPWKQRIDKVIWRGSPTGRGPVPLRPRVVNLLPFVGHADVDACFPIFNSVGGNATLAKENLAPFGVTCPDKRMTFNKFAEYRYILDMDGNSWSDRFIHLLTLGSTVFKQESEFEDFATIYARPFIHYIPLKRDLSDLEAAVQKCREHPTYCAKVAENGVKLARGELGTERRMEAWRDRLVEYWDACGK